MGSRPLEPLELGVQWDLSAWNHWNSAYNGNCPPRKLGGQITLYAEFQGSKVARWHCPRVPSGQEPKLSRLTFYLALSADLIRMSFIESTPEPNKLSYKLKCSKVEVCRTDSIPSQDDMKMKVSHCMQTLMDFIDMCPLNNKYQLFDRVSAVLAGEEVILWLYFVENSLFSRGLGYCCLL